MEYFRAEAYPKYSILYQLEFCEYQQIEKYLEKSFKKILQNRKTDIPLHRQNKSTDKKRIYSLMV